MRPKKLSPLHPGEVLIEEFLKPMNISRTQLADDIRVSRRRITEIALCKRGITADTALRLARYFRVSPQFWLGLQMDNDINVAEDKSAKKVEREVRVYAAAA